jgi:hypothetical protein
METSAIIDSLFDLNTEQQEVLTIGGRDVQCLPIDEDAGATLIPGGYWGDYDAHLLVKLVDLDDLDLKGVRTAIFRGQRHHMKEYRQPIAGGYAIFHLKCDQPPR